MKLQNEPNTFFLQKKQKQKNRKKTTTTTQQLKQVPKESLFTRYCVV